MYVFSKKLVPGKRQIAVDANEPELASTPLPGLPAMSISERLKAPKDVIAGLIFLLSGAVLFFWSQDYEMGTATRMGPGYFPALLGIILCIFGLIGTVKGLLAQTPDPLPDHGVLPLVFMVAAVVSFSLLIERAGFAVASFISIVLVCYQRVRTKPLEILLIFIGLNCFVYVVFIYLFGMTMRFFWWN